MINKDLLYLSSSEAGVIIYLIVNNIRSSLVGPIPREPQLPLYYKLVSNSQIIHIYNSTEK